MVISRKNIISKAESAQIAKDANETTKPVNQTDTEDVWFDKQTLYKVGFILRSIFSFKITFFLFC